jgi:hypothetical protein
MWPSRAAMAGVAATSGAALACACGVTTRHHQGQQATTAAAGRSAYATLTTNDEYMVGVVALYRSLLAAGALSAERPLVVMVTRDVSTVALAQLRAAAEAAAASAGADGGSGRGGCGPAQLPLEVELVEGLGNPAEVMCPSLLSTRTHAHALWMVCARQPCIPVYGACLLASLPRPSR